MEKGSGQASYAAVGAVPYLAFAASDKPAFPMKTPHKRPHHRRKGRSPEKRGPRREHIEELHPTADPPDIETFEEWDLGEEIQLAIRNMDITVPTPIQKLAIGPVLEGRDVIAKAETGTGKTLAFGAPMMSRIDATRSTVLGLVLCPTRELAQQVADVLATLALPLGVRVALVVGGDPVHPQIAALQAGAQVVVGTPGRVLDLYQQRFLSFPWTEFAVLDEADKMFEIGFLDDIKKILALLPDERRTLLFSATFPTEVLKLARAETTNPVEVATAKGTSTVASIEQKYIEIEDGDRPLALTRLLENSGEKDVFLVFCDRRVEVDRLMRRLDRLPFEVKALHGGYDQAARFRVMSAFRTGEVKALVATDVASRGLDVNHVTHVVNYSVPRDVEDYTHRIGRTGRAGREGTAITFVMPLDRRRWAAHMRQGKFNVEQEDLPSRGGSRARSRTESTDSRSSKPASERPRDRSRDASDQEGRGRQDRGPRPQRREDAGRPKRDAARRERGERDEQARRDERPRRHKRGEEDSRSETRGARDRKRPQREERPARARRDERPERKPREDGRSRGRGRRAEHGEEDRGRPKRSSSTRLSGERTPKKSDGKRTDERDPAPFGTLPELNPEPKRASKGRRSGLEKRERGRKAEPRTKEKPSRKKESDDTGFGAGL